jgi:tRNA(Ile)-lysidine synthase
LADARAVKALCGTLRERCGIKLPLHSVHVRPGVVAKRAQIKGCGVEAAARHYRMNIFRQEIERLQKKAECGGGELRLLTAHTRDDLLETILMRFLRGSGPAGLAGIKGRRLLPGLVLERPMLGLGRRDVLAFLEEEGLSYRTDSSNSDPYYLRNRIRLHLIPFLDSEFPSWRKRLPALAQTQGDVAAFLGEAAAALEWKPLKGGLEITSQGFEALPLIVREEALFRAGDRLLALHSGSSASSPQWPRKGLRAFAAGEIKALDAGKLRFERTAGTVRVQLVLRHQRAQNRASGCTERALRILLKKQGFYTIEKVVRLELCSGSEAPIGPTVLAQLPLLVRNAYGEDSVDEGRAAPCSFELARKRMKGKGGGEATPGCSLLLALEDRDGVAAFIGTGSGAACWLARRPLMPQRRDAEAEPKPEHDDNRTRVKLLGVERG